jgi:Uma2 family endonuclease
MFTPTQNKPSLLKPINPLDSLPRNVTFQEYLKLYNSVEGARTEWVAGTVEVYDVSTSRKHAELLGFLHVLFMFFMAKNKPGKIYLSDFPMYISDNEPAREPDLMIVFQEHQDRIQPTYLDGIADLVLEIVSPESGARDRGDKFIEYERFGVPEYWLLDPIRQSAIVYTLNAEGIYQPVPVNAPINRTCGGFIPNRHSLVSCQRVSRL